MISSICYEIQRMAKNKSSSYNGEPSAAEIPDGMNAALRNARRLADEV